MPERPLHVIAGEILLNWTTIDKSPAAEYARAMQSLRTLEDMYHADSAIEVVARFLGLANTWRGPVARRVKDELRTMLKRRDTPDNIWS